VAGSFGEVIPLDKELAEQLEALKEGRPWYGDGVAVKLYSLQMSKDPQAEEVISSGAIGKRVWLTGEYTVLSDAELQKLKTEWDHLDRTATV